MKSLEVGDQKDRVQPIQVMVRRLQRCRFDCDSRVIRRFLCASRCACVVLALFALRCVALRVQLSNFPRYTEMAKLTADHVSQLVSVRGIVVAAGRPRLKATMIAAICKSCKAQKLINVPEGFGGVRLPRECDTKNPPGSGIPKCPLDPYQVIADNTQYVDQQR